MGKILLHITLLLVIHHAATAQGLPGFRKNHWSHVGYQPKGTPEKAIYITEFGGDATGISSNNDAFNMALEALGTEGGTIRFAGGDYFFDQPISLPSNVQLMGDGHLTTLKFDLGGKEDAIIVRGEAKPTNLSLRESANIGQNRLLLNHTDGLVEGSFLKIGYIDSEHTTSSWASNSVAQLIKVVEINGSEIVLESPLRLPMDIEKPMAISEIMPVRNSGISCLEIVRVDETVDQTSNIAFTYAQNCFVQNVISQFTNFAHIEMFESSQITVTGCYFRYSHHYGAGGQGYGVMMHFSSGECLIENNIFEHLRHSIILQAGANGNVVSYNYSTQPYWEGTSLPQNSAGDLVLHGNYPFANLFEGNVMQNIVIDHSHGKNGYHNTFFRNTAELYGFIINPGPAADSTNLIGNIISNSEFLKGNFFISGEGNYSNGNTVRGKLIPEASTNVTERSLYFSELPPFLQDYVNKKSAFRNQAEERFKSKTFTICQEPVTEEEEKEDDPVKDDDTKSTSIDDLSFQKIGLYPNPANNVVHLKAQDYTHLEAYIYNTSGQLVAQFSNTISMDISNLKSGIYHVLIRNDQSEVETRKLVVEETL